jgi:hypothetical protein
MFFALLERSWRLLTKNWTDRPGGCARRTSGAPLLGGTAQTPVALFPVALIFGTGINKQQYTVSRDGRFLGGADTELQVMPSCSDSRRHRF